MGSIYKIRNKVNGKYYIGRSDQIKTRFARHRYELRQGRHHCIHLQRAWDKYGEIAFEFVIIYECDAIEAEDIEETWLNSGDKLIYNVSRLSGGGDLLSHHPQREQIIARRNKAARERMSNLTPQERLQYGRPGERNGMYGRKHSEASRQKMSETQRLKMKCGPEHPNFGIKRSEETRARISQIASARTGKSNPFYGRTHSEATKAALAASRRGKLPTNVRPVVAEGNSYPSVTEAARQLGITPSLVIYRIKSPKYAYAYATHDPHPAIRAPVSV